MRRKTAGRVYHQRQCAYCKGGIAETRPVFLVRTESGLIVGPYHAGCADKVTRAAKKAGYVAEVKADKVLGEWNRPREETLPW